MPELRLPHTRKRKGIIEYQRFVPKHLQALCGGKAWFIRSTGERTTRDAKPNWARFEVAYDDLIRAARAAYEAAAKSGFNGSVREIWIERQNGHAALAGVSTLSYGPAGSYMPLPGLQTREIPLQGQRRPLPLCLCASLRRLCCLFGPPIGIRSRSRVRYATRVPR